MSKASFYEIAGIRDGRDITRGWLNSIGNYLPTQDSLLLLKSAGDLRLYEQVAQDDQVKSCLQQRFRAVTAHDWDVKPGGDKRIDKYAAEDLERQLKNFKWDDCNEKMLWGVFYGYSAAEVIWGRDAERVTIDRIVVKNRRRFVFNEDQQLALRTFQTPLGEVLPEQKFWHFKVGADHDDEPYGRGLAHWLYWPTFFKRNGVRWWLRFLELFASPARKGKYPARATQDEKDVLWNALEAFGQDDRMMIPEGLEIEFLESSRNGSVDYKSLCDQMDAAIAKIILSQTMTTDNGSSRSQAEVHQDVAESVIESDADLICDSFNDTVVKWLTDWNFPGAAYPRVHRRLESEPDLVALANRDKVLSDMGFPPSPEYIEDTYGDGFEQPEPVEPPLSVTQLPSFISILSQAKQQGWGSDTLRAALAISFPLIPEPQLAALIKGFDNTQQNPALGGAPTGGDGTDPNAQPATSPPDLSQVASMFAAPAPAKKKNCQKGISCGGTCIAGNKICARSLSEHQQQLYTQLKAAAKKGGAADKANLDKFTSDTIKSQSEQPASKPEPKPEPKPVSKSEPKPEPKQVAATTAPAPDKNQLKSLKDKLLAMSEGTPPDDISISAQDIKYAQNNFMDNFAEKYVKNKINKITAENPQISKPEAAALSTWIGSKYTAMNKILYGGDLNTWENEKAIKTTDLLAAKALHKLPPATVEQIAANAKEKGEKFDPTAPLGRYMHVDDPAEFVKQYQEAMKGDGTIRESTFFATSHIPCEEFGFCTYNTNLTYEVKPKLDGTGSGRYIDHFKNSMSEGEVLYPPESKFRVVGVIPPKLTSVPKLLKLSDEEKKQLDDGLNLMQAKNLVTLDPKPKAKKDKSQSVIAYHYKNLTGEDLPSEDINKIESAAKVAQKKQAAYAKKNSKTLEKYNGTNRDTNWVVQLEEI